MNCMKCGTELKNPGVFCPDCLADMEKYPVKPNITVHLPRRPAVTAAKKKTRRVRYVNPDDQIRHLRQQRNLLTVLLVVSLLAFAAVSYLTVQLMSGKDISFDIGQNYGTVDTTADTSAGT